MSKDKWNTTDRILFGIVYGAIAGGILLHAVSCIIEACRTRPKVQMMVLSLKGVKDSKPGPDESSSAAVEQ